MDSITAETNLNPGGFDVSNTIVVAAPFCFPFFSF